MGEADFQLMLRVALGLPAAIQNLGLSQKSPNQGMEMTSNQYLTLTGEALEYSDANWLKVEHILQRYRDVWVVVDGYPHLAIDKERVDFYLSTVTEFIVLSAGYLQQNISRKELGTRMLSMLIGGGTTAGFSPRGKSMVEGRANPKANHLMRFNHILQFGTHPFAAADTHYIFSDGVNLYQREFGKLNAEGKRSRTESQHVDFLPLSDLTHALHMAHLDQSTGATIDLARISTLLDDIFVENLKIHAAARAHHDAAPPSDEVFDYEAPILTKYGRLVHDATGAPQIEMSFALLHYEKAIREFNDLKAATERDDVDASFLHGVYCIVAVAACIEAIANKLVFMATGLHPDYRDRRTPFAKINGSAKDLAAALGRVFQPLAKGQATFDSLERARIMRNSFMHANEAESDVHQTELTSTIVESSGELGCREFLYQLRLAVTQIYDQFPEYGPPIVTRTNVKWMGDMEVP